MSGVKCQCRGGGGGGGGKVSGVKCRGVKFRG